MFASGFVPCATCGASVDPADSRSHRCDRGRVVDYQMFAMRHEIAWFEQLFSSYLDTPAGRLDSWVAARTVRSR